MNREIHETLEDLENEKKIQLILEVKWNCRLIKTPKYHPADFFAFKIRNGIINYDRSDAFIEVKCRKIKSGWKEYEIAKQKIDRGIEEARKMKIPYILVIKFEDKIMFHKAADPPQYDSRMGGRTKTTRDQWDIEMMYIIPMDQFTEVKESWE